MEVSQNTLLLSIVGLLALVVITQVGFFRHKENKLNSIITGITGWMENQEKINNALSMAVVELDTTLVDNKILTKSIVNDYVRESMPETEK
jgi:hypothetical protein